MNPSDDNDGPMSDTPADGGSTLVRPFSLEAERALSSANQPTNVTAELAGAGPLNSAQPLLFEQLVSTYLDLLRPLLFAEAIPAAEGRPRKEHLVARVGDAGGGPRDLLDIHLEALDRTPKVQHLRPYSIVAEARLLALELMGLLVDYYRVGHRRRFPSDSP